MRLAAFPPDSSDEKTPVGGALPGLCVRTRLSLSSSCAFVTIHFPRLRLIRLLRDARPARGRLPHARLQSTRSNRAGAGRPAPRAWRIRGGWSSLSPPSARC